MGQLPQAIMVATQAHEGQLRKYHGTPYIIHPLEVMSILTQYNIVNHDMLMAAVLHDTVEDTEMTQNQIDVMFGPDVGHLISLLTDLETDNRAERKRLQRERLGGSQNREAQTVKCADLISNARDIKEHDPKFWKTFQQEGEALLDVMTFAYQPLRMNAYAALA